MRFNKKNWVLNAFVLGLALGCGVFPGMAAEDRPPPQDAVAVVNPDQEEPTVVFETEGDFFLGYRWVSTEDSLKAAEYIYPHSSFSFGLNLLSCPLPFRYNVNAAFISKHDFYSDVGFAYKDLVLFRDILVGVHHNLDHYNFKFDDEPLPKIHNDENPADYYYIDFVSNLMSLRLKAPDFPFHTFLNHRHVERDGRIEQRFLLGYFDQFEKVSESRDIEWKSNAVKLGANSHLGPVEIEYAYDEAEFNPGPNNILYDIYPEFVGPPYRPEDIYPHNVIPETESSAHTIKMHSSYTGGIVAAATLSNLFQKNNYSLTESTTWKGAFDLSWIPDPVIGLFFKYRHRDMDIDNPDVVTLKGLNNSIDYSVRQGISYDKDVFSLSTRYRPMQRLSLYAGYEFSQLDRQDVTEWLILTPQTKIHSIDLKAQARPLDKVTVKAIYEYKNYDQPAYNTTPDKSNKLRLTTTYTPSPSLNVYLEYILFLTERDPLRYLNGDPPDLLETGGRDSRGDQILASLSTAISPKASLTFSWFYQRWDIEQDLIYGKWPGTGDPPFFMDTGVPYTDKSNSFSLSLHYMPRQDFTVAADLTYTIGEGTTEYGDVLGGAPFSLSTFSNMETSETIFSLDLAKKLPKDWEIGLRLYFDVFNDKVFDLLDGNVFTTTFSLKRYF
jgi:hypothetical protein